MTNQNLEKAREWADRTLNNYPFPSHEGVAARLIQSLPDQWVDVEKVREIIESKEGRPPATALPELLYDLRNLLTPKLRTLADMTAEEREACKWMQCMIGDDTDEYCLLITVDTPCSRVIFQNGNSTIWNNDLITPLTGEPKFKWPGGGDAPTIAQKEKVADDQQPNSSETPKSSINPEDVPPNEPWLIEVEGEKYVGTRYAGDSVVPWSVAALDGSFAGDFNDHKITLIHKLVPEAHALPEGMRLADHPACGRVVVSPYTNDDGVHRAYKLTDANIYGASLTLVHADDLTFLDGGN